MSEFLRELGYDPLYYWMLAGTSFLLWIASALLPWNPTGPALQRINRPAVFGLLLLAAMLAWRWPALCHFKPVNPDESQFLSGAITALARGNVWWCDAMTSGPLVVLPLALPGLLGLPVDFGSARLIGLLLGWGTVFLTYLILRHIHGEQKSRLLVMPLACFHLFLIFWDFAPYSSEPSPYFLCALATWLCVTAFQPDGLVRRRWRLAAGGFIIGLLPFSKFQVMPMGAAIGLTTFCWVVCQPAAKSRTIVQDLIGLIGSVAAAIGVMLLSVVESHEWANVYEAYLVHNLHYTRARGLPWSDSGYILTYLTDLSWGFSSFHFGALLLLLVGQLGLRRFAWRPLLLGWLLLVATYVAVITPGRLYPHYLLFLAMPLTLLAGLQWGYLLNGKSRGFGLVFGALYLSVGMGAQLIDRVIDRQSMHKLIAVANPRNQVVAYINRRKHAGDTLAVWGWRPELYIETQLPQGTRESLTEAQLNPNRQRDYFRARFMADLRENQPAFFVDSVGPEDYLLNDRLRQGHENLPGLGEYVAQHYAQVGSGDSFRVYVRRDRLEPHP